MKSMWTFFAGVVFLSTTTLSAPLCNTTLLGNSPLLDLMPSTVNTLQLALFLEHLEVAFMESAVTNLTTSDSRYGDLFNSTVSSALEQEITHRDVLRDIIEASGATAIPACQYTFPSYNTSQFLELGRSLSSVGVGAGIALTENIASSDIDLIPRLASIATTEARHSAFFEASNGKIPNPTAFDTPVPGIWAFNLALSLSVPGSCGSLPSVPVLPTLTIKGVRQANGTVVELAWDPAQATFKAEGNKPLFIVWLNQMNLPVYTTLVMSGNGNGFGTMPKDLEGPVAIALTANNQFVEYNELAAATLAGPAILIQY